MNWDRIKAINYVGWFSLIVTTALCAVDELNLQGAGIYIPPAVFKAIAVINAVLKTVNPTAAVKPLNPSLTPLSDEFKKPKGE